VKSLLAVALLVLLPQARPAPKPEWAAPREEKSKANPVQASDESLKKGRALYQRHCAMCHGDRGKGDGAAARLHAQRSNRTPKDLTDAKTQALLSDGEIFWKLSVGFKEDGRIIMPPFAEEIPKEEDRWKLVNFVRSFGKED
jgi:mono/diheme cytochrome c family protein